VTPNTHLSRLSLVRIECNLSETKARLSNINACDLFDNDFINIHFYQVSNKVTECLMHGTHESRKSILKIIRHRDIAKEVIYCYKCSMFFIFSRHWYLMETRICI
jgi:hypothetical protein